jgi:Predicted transcriptional regulators
MSTPEAQFDFKDGKDPGALRTIGEVAQAVGLRQHVLRYWEEQFPELRPIKRSGGRRYYRTEDVALIVEIDRLVHREGYTLRGAAKAISGKSSEKVATNTEALPAMDAEARQLPLTGMDADALRRLVAIRDGLSAALAAA